jgi:hypothetical protein
MNRRTFLTSSLAAGAAIGTGALASGQTYPAPTPGTEPAPKASLELAQVKEFVVAGHGNLPRVKDMLTSEPMFINVTWDWGVGDVETAIGGASHVGNRELALHLIDAGSRFDVFCAAMLGEAELISSLLRLHPEIANARGPHGYTLLYHAGYTGNVSMTEAISAQITPDARARHFNQTLQSAVNRGHTDLVAYLLDHGVDNPNSKNGRGQTPLDVAVAKNFEPVAQLLRAHGGVAATSL